MIDFDEFGTTHRAQRDYALDADRSQHTSSLSPIHKPQRADNNFIDDVIPPPPVSSPSSSSPLKQLASSAPPALRSDPPASSSASPLLSALPLSPSRWELDSSRWELMQKRIDTWKRLYEKELAQRDEQIRQLRSQMSKVAADSTSLEEQIARITVRYSHERERYRQVVIDVERSRRENERLREWVAERDRDIAAAEQEYRRLEAELEHKAAELKELAKQVEILTTTTQLGLHRQREDIHKEWIEKLEQIDHENRELRAQLRLREKRANAAVEQKTKQIEVLARQVTMKEKEAEEAKLRVVAHQRMFDERSKELEVNNKRIAELREIIKAKEMRRDIVRAELEKLERTTTDHNAEENRALIASLQEEKEKALQAVQMKRQEIRDLEQKKVDYHGALRRIREQRLRKEEEAIAAEAKLKEREHVAAEKEKEANLRRRKVEEKRKTLTENKEKAKAQAAEIDALRKLEAVIKKKEEEHRKLEAQATQQQQEIQEAKLRHEQLEKELSSVEVEWQELKGIADMYRRALEEDAKARGELSQENSTHAQRFAVLAETLDVLKKELQATTQDLKQKQEQMVRMGEEGLVGIVPQKQK